MWWDRLHTRTHARTQTHVCACHQGFPQRCVSGLSGYTLSGVVFQTVSSSSPSRALLHLVCNAALAICVRLDSNYEIVRVALPVAWKFLLSHTLKNTESHLNEVYVFYFVWRSRGGYRFSLCSLCVALNAKQKKNGVWDYNAKSFYFPIRGGKGQALIGGESTNQLPT